MSKRTLSYAFTAALGILMQTAYSADLTTFSAGSPISSSEINANFKALDDEVVASPNIIQIGNQAIVTGSITVSGGGQQTVNFPIQFSQPPTLMVNMRTDSTIDQAYVEAWGVTGSKFDTFYVSCLTDVTSGSCVAKTNRVEYIAIGPVASP